MAMPPGPRKLGSRDPHSLASKKFRFAEGDWVLERVLFVVNQEVSGLYCDAQGPRTE